MKPWETTASARAQLVGLAVAACLLLPACNVIDIALGRDAKIEKMVPGGSAATGGLSCWLTFNFARLPSGVDPTDVIVRFESEALAEPAEFDWAYIAANDYLVTEAGSGFGAGHRKAEHTTPSQPPALGKPTKVNFALKARRQIDANPDQIWLHATLYWGGKKQHSYKRNIAHVYSSRPGGFL
jgi:hypothetical protein